MDETVWVAYRTDGDWKLEQFANRREAEYWIKWILGQGWWSVLILKTVEVVKKP